MTLRVSSWIPDKHTGDVLWQHRWDLLKDLGLVALLALGMKFLEFHGWTGSAEGLAADFALAAAPSGDAPIVIIEIDDTAYTRYFNAQSPLCPEKVISLVSMIDSWRPKVIGVDLVTDSADYSALRHEWEMRPVVWAAAGTADLNEREGFGAWLVGIGGELHVDPAEVLGRPAVDARAEWAIPIFPRDSDRAVRRFPREVFVVGRTKPQATWAAKIGEVYCEGRCAASHPSELLIPYRSPIGDRYKLCELIPCPGESPENSLSPQQMETLRSRIMKQKSIVLLGGTFGAARDEYDTPIGPTSGLVLNAYAVRAEISGGVTELHPPIAGFALDLLIGIFISVKFILREHAVDLDRLGLIRWLFGFYAWVIGVALFVSLVLAAWVGLLWISWVGVILVLFVSLLADVYRKTRPENISDAS